MHITFCWPVCNMTAQKAGKRSEKDLDDDTSMFLTSRSFLFHLTYLSLAFRLNERTVNEGRIKSTIKMKL